MDAITEIDKAGRIVVPKCFRDSMHLVPGTRLLLSLEGKSLIIQPEGASGLYKKKGLWVHHGSGTVTAEQVRDLIDSGREQGDRKTVVAELVQ